MERAVLHVTGLVAGYGGQAVVRLSELKVERGACMLVVGPSGSGKTTLLLAIAGLAQTLAGSIAIDGDDVTKLPPVARDRRRGARIGLVFQDLHLIAGLSALDNVLLSPFAAGVEQDRERALQLLSAMGLSPKARQPAERLSRGEAQRAAIARAMLLKPALILADEPTSSLDDPTCEAVASLLERAAKDTGAALVIATHDRRLRTRFADAVEVEAA
jgi:putative ABC transport system ATP-binding protein